MNHKKQIKLRITYIFITIEISAGIFSKFFLYSLKKYVDQF